MRRTKLLLCSLLLSAGVAQAGPLDSLAVAAGAAAPVAESGSGRAILAPAGEVAVKTPTTAIVREQHDEAEQDIARRLAARKRGSIASVDELAGQWVFTYQTPFEYHGCTDGGFGMTVTPIAGTDSIAMDFAVLDNYGGKTRATIKARVNLGAGTLTIPAGQRVYSTEQHDFALYSARPGEYLTLKSDKPITATLLDDGSFAWSSWIVNAETSDVFLLSSSGCEGGTLMRRPNATVTGQVLTLADGQVKTVPVTWPVVATQTGKNMLEVANLGDKGFTVQVELRDNNTPHITNQTIYSGPGGNQYIAQFQDYSINPAAGSVSYGSCDYIFDGEPSTDGKQITLRDIGLRIPGVMIVEIYPELTINLNTAASFPKLAMQPLDGGGTEGSPYLIRTAGDLITLADMVTDATSQEGKFFRLENDIDLDGYVMPPIGNFSSYRFCGVFDGNGHTLKNLHMVNHWDRPMFGLFGYIGATGTVMNLTLDGAFIEASTKYVGALAGCSLGSIENCAVRRSRVNNTRLWNYHRAQYTGILAGVVRYVSDCNVTDSRLFTHGGYAGGLASMAETLVENSQVSNSDIQVDLYAGYGDDSNGFSPFGGLVANVAGGTTISKSYYMGNFNIRSMDVYSAFVTAGGLVGDASIFDGAERVYGVKFDNCFANFSASWDIGRSWENLYSRHSGGLVGVIDAGSTMSNCFAAGSVAMGLDFGGLVGKVEKTSNNYNPFTIVRCYTTANGYFLPNHSRDVASGEAGIRSPIYQAAASAVALNYVYYDNQICWENPTSNYSLATAELTAATGPQGFQASRWTYREGFYPVQKVFEDNADALAATAAVVCGAGNSFRRFVDAADIHLPDGVTAATVGGHIAVAGDRLTLREGAGVGIDTLRIGDSHVKWFRLVQAIPEFTAPGSGTESDPYLIGSKAELMNVQSYTNIVDETFAGKHFRLTADIDLEGDTEFVGLKAFDGVFDGDGHIVTNAPKALVTTLNADAAIKNLTRGKGCMETLVMTNNGLIENCRSEADDEAGWGIARINNGIVQHCLNTGKAACGIALSSNGTLTDCVNLGTVSVAGIVGALRGTLTRCVNTGAVLGEDDNCKGISHISSNDAAIDQVVNYGAVAGGKSMGGYGIAIAATAVSAPQVSAALYDAQLCGESDTLATAMTTAQLTAGVMPEGFDADAWSFEAGMYPMLKSWLGDEQADKARRTVVSLPAGVNIRDLAADATLTRHDGLRWTLARGTAFGIEGDRLKTVAQQKTLVVDTLLATAGELTKVIPLRRMMLFPLAGEGTEAAPYLIGTVEDWLNTNDWMNAKGDDFDGKFLQVTQDIDFGAMQFVGLTADFNGTFLGNGKTFRNMRFTATAPSQRMATFYRVGPNGTVRDLTVEGAFTGIAWKSGGIAGINAGVIENCVNKVDITASTTCIGGIAGILETRAQVIGCTNHGTITNSSRVGGIVGDGLESWLCRIDGNVNLGTVKGTTSSGRVGGIVGGFMEKASISYNVNAAPIFGVSRVGGIVGEARYGDEILNNLNTGDITASNGEVGGICGGGNGIGNNSLLHYCVNTGRISGNDRVGGILGTYGAHMDGCVNAGTVTAPRSSDHGNLIGVPSYIELFSSAQNCYYVTDFGYVEGDTIGTAVTLDELCALDLNSLGGTDVWTHYDDYSLSMPSGIAGLDVVKVAAAEVIVADGDTRRRVTQPFNVGQPEGVSWTTDAPALRFAGNDVRFAASLHRTATVTVSAGEFSRSVELDIDFDHPADVSGDGNIDIADINVVINAMLGRVASDELLAACDVTGDGNIDIADVNAVINAMLGK